MYELLSAVLFQPFWDRENLSVFLQVSWNHNFKKFMRSALDLVFLRKNYTSVVLQLKYAGENFGVINQVCHIGTSKLLITAQAKFIASAYSQLKQFYGDRPYESDHFAHIFT